jgi:hypothetical protein
VAQAFATVGAAQVPAREGGSSEPTVRSFETGVPDQEAAGADREPEPAVRASVATVYFAQWVGLSGDNGGLPFVVIDKLAATVSVFEPNGQFLGATSALIGLAHGDESVPGIGERPLSTITPEERTTPAGRFVAKYGPAIGQYPKVLWVDYAGAVALHPIVTSNKKERRLERLRSPNPEDNRITYGCINVSKTFYEVMVRSVFENSSGIVYILPENRALAEVFPAFPAQASAQILQPALRP